MKYVVVAINYYTNTLLGWVDGRKEGNEWRESPYPLFGWEKIWKEGEDEVDCVSSQTSQYTIPPHLDGKGRKESRQKRISGQLTILSSMFLQFFIRFVALIELDSYLLFL